MVGKAEEKGGGRPRVTGRDREKAKVPGKEVERGTKDSAGDV